jgi:hypothetical protein
VWLNAWDISGFLNATDLTIKQEVPDVTAFSDAGPRRLVGNYDHSHTHSGFIDTADDSFDENMFGLLTAAGPLYLAKMFGASAAGSVVYESIVDLSEQPRSAAIGNAILLNFNAEGASGIARGLVLENGTKTADGDGTGRNCGASVAGQTLLVVFRVFSGVYTRIDMHIEESTVDGGADPYADIAGLTASFVVANSAAYSVATTVAATEAWKRVVISNWAGTSAIIGVTCGILS